MPKSEYLEDQLLDLLRSSPASKLWDAREIEEKLGWNRPGSFCKHPPQNQLAACISRKLEEDGLVRVSQSGGRGPVRVRLV